MGVAFYLANQTTQRSYQFLASSKNQQASIKDFETWRNQYWNLNKIKSRLNIKQQRRFGWGLAKQTVKQKIFIEEAKILGNS